MLKVFSWLHHVYGVKGHSQRSAICAAKSGVAVARLCGLEKKSQLWNLGTTGNAHNIDLARLFPETVLFSSSSCGGGWNEDWFILDTRERIARAVKYERNFEIRRGHPLWRKYPDHRGHKVVRWQSLNTTANAAACIQFECQCNDANNLLELRISDTLTPLGRKMCQNQNEPQ